MWVEAIVSREDFQALAAELLPVRVQLGAADSDHHLFLSAAREVSLVEGRGLRVVCDAQIRWPVLGIDLPVNVDSLTVMLEPSVPSEGGELFIGVQLEHADVAWVPALLDEKIVASINEALEKRRADLCWNFAKTLSYDFAIPAMLQPLLALSLKAGWGKVRVTSEAMVLVISFQLHAMSAELLQSASDAHALVARSPASRPAASALARSPSRQSASLGAIAGTMTAVVGSYFAARLAYDLLVPGSRRRRLA